MTIIIITFLLVTTFFLYSERKNKEILYYVYINEKTKKYHSEECPYSKDLKEMSLKDAIKNGYIPCKICNPR